MSLTSSLARAVARPVASPLAGASSGGSAINLLLGTAIQRHLENGETYDSTQYNGKFILKNLAPTGQSYSAVVNPPCWTGAGAAYIDFGGASLIPTGDWTLEFDALISSLASGNSFFTQYDSTVKGLLVYHDPTNGWWLFYGGTDDHQGGSTADVDTWYAIKVVHSGTTTTLFVDDVEVAQIAGHGDVPQIGTLAGAYGNGTPYNTAITDPLKGSLSNIKITAGGEVNNIPLQEGGGTLDFNRNVYSCSTDGTGEIYQDAIKLGTVSAIWAEVMPGTIKDWSILYGSGMGMYGESIPGCIGAAIDAEGNTKRWAAGKLSNRYSIVDFNPNAEAELTAISAESAYQIIGDRAFTATTDTKFARLADSSVDRLVAFAAAVTGADLVTIQAYCPTSWQLRLACHNTDSGFAAGAGTQWDNLRTQFRRYRPDILEASQVTVTTYLDRVNEQNGLLADSFSSGGEGVYFQSLHSRYAILNSEVVGSGVGGDEFPRPPGYAEIDFGHPTKTLGIYSVHMQTAGTEGIIAADPTAKEQNQFRRAVEWYRIAEHIATKRAANPNLLIVVLGDWNDDPSLEQYVTVLSSATGGTNLYAGFVLAASTPTSFSYQFYPTDQATAADLAIVPATNLVSDPSTLWIGDPNALVIGAGAIDHIAVDELFTIVAGEICDSEVTQTGGILKYGAALASTISRDTSYQKMLVADISIT